MSKRIMLILILAKVVFLLLTGCSKNENIQISQKANIELRKLLRTKDSTIIYLNLPDTTDLHIHWSASIGNIKGENNKAIYYSTDTQGLTTIEASYENTNNIAITNSANILVYKQLVILKADDFVFDKENVFTPRWISFLEFIKSKNIKASLGIIGNSLEQGNNDYFTYLKSLASSGEFELWNHGYTHILNGVDSLGRKYDEFFNRPLNYQLDHILKTQNLAKEKLDVTLHTFGAPGNAIDSTTMKALNEVSDIKVWYDGLNDTSKLILKTSFEIEHPAGIPNFDRFKKYYPSKAPFFVFQIHPNAWDANRLSEFEKVTDFLIQNGVTFITPYEYYKLTH